MKDQDKIDRRAFTLQSVMAMLAGVTITLSGCGDDDDPNDPTPAPETGDISANHGHTAVVSSAELTGGAAIMLTVEGSANHRHTLELTVAELTQIRNQVRVAKDTTVTNNHSHTVTFNG
jgi:hypothetical protein